MILTAKELFEQKHPQDGTLPQWTKDLMIEFAKLHVEAALKEASENVKWKEQITMQGLQVTINKSSILNAYPTSNIK